MNTTQTPVTQLPRTPLCGTAPKLGDREPVPVGTGDPGPRTHRTGHVIESHAAHYPITIDETRHMVLWVTRCIELVVFSTDCGCTADTAHDDLDSPHRANCQVCIPFHHTR